MELVENQGEDDYCQLVGLNAPQQQSNAAQTIGSSSADDTDEIEIVEVR